MKVTWVGSGDTVYDRVGGSDWFYKLLDYFYEDIIRRNEIRDLYPDDLTDSKKNISDFSDDEMEGLIGDEEKKLKDDQLIAILVGVAAAEGISLVIG